MLNIQDDVDAMAMSRTTTWLYCDGNESVHSMGPFTTLPQYVEVVARH